MPQVPALTPQQRKEALAKAAKARSERAKIKSKLKMGLLSLPKLLQQAEKNETLAKMKVLSVLEPLPGLGKIKARRLLEYAGISEFRRIQGLGSNQKQVLLDYIEGR